MACSLRASDIVAVCLVLSDFDAGTSVEGIIRNVEKYQNSNKRHFGVSLKSFRHAFYWLAYELGLCGPSEFDMLPGLLDIIPFHEWINPILDYKELLFSEEGEYWNEKLEVDERLNGDEGEWYEDDFYNAEYERAIRVFFDDPEKHTELSIKEFFNNNGIYADILENCSVKDVHGEKSV